MSGGSDPNSPVTEGRKTIAEGIRELTNDVRCIALDDVPECRVAVTAHDPTGLCGLVESRSDFCVGFVCGAGLSVWSPTEDMWDVQKIGESSTQRRLPSRKAR